MKFFRSIFFLFLPTLFLSCNLFNLFYRPLELPEEKKTYPEYELDVEWELEFPIGYYRSYNTLQVDKYMYIPIIDGGNFHLSKVNLDKGFVEWNTDEFVRDEYNRYFVNTYPLKNKDKVYYVVNDTVMLVFNDNDGSLCAKVVLEGENFFDDEAEKLVIAKEKYLCWQHRVKNNNKLDGGIVMLNLDEIDWSSPEKELVVVPEYVFEFSYENKNRKGDFRILEYLEEKDGIVYFQTQSPSYSNVRSELGAVDVESRTVLWNKEFKGINGTGRSALMVQGDYLFSFELDAGCYNRFTGEPLWQFIIAEEEKKEEFKTSYQIGDCEFLLSGYTYEDGVIYYTSGECPSSNSCFTPERSEDYISNVRCIDPVTAKFKWATYIKDSGSLCSKPILCKGKVFIQSCGYGLYVLDQKTGKVLGVDYDFYCGEGDDPNAQWKDCVYFFNYNKYTGIAKLTCIKV